MQTFRQSQSIDLLHFLVAMGEEEESPSSPRPLVDAAAPPPGETDAASHDSDDLDGDGILNEQEQAAYDAHLEQQEQQVLRRLTSLAEQDRASGTATVLAAELPPRFVESLSRAPAVPPPSSSSSSSSSSSVAT